MGLVLSSDNVLDYLKNQKISSDNSQLISPVEAREYKNFNLIVKLTNQQNYLVKQERIDSEGNTSGELEDEWLMQKLVNSFPDLQVLQPLISQAIYYDSDNSLIVLDYYLDYVSLTEFYHQTKNYPPEIGATIGKNLGLIHRLTFEQQQYKNFLREFLDNYFDDNQPNFPQTLEKINPRIFSHIASDGLDFFRLYQQYPSLHQAVKELYNNFQPSCLTHNDLRLCNFLIYSPKEVEPLTRNSEEIKLIKIIDWEFLAWGDPAADLGVLLSQYLAQWLNSLVINSNLDLSVSLKSATCPLEKIQPTLLAILEGYLSSFPMILHQRTDFIKRAVQYAGVHIIKRIKYHIENHEPFDNISICKLQVAKNLLCYPDKGIISIFGNSATNKY